MKETGARLEACGKELSQARDTINVLRAKVGLLDGLPFH